MQRMKHLAKRLVSLTGNLSLAAVILACAAYLLPHLMGYERYVITGGSMYGSFEKGSVVFEKPVPVEDLALGDVITYLPPADSGVGNLVTHRIVEIETDDAGQLVMRTKGDANGDVDPWTFSLVDEKQPVVEYTVPQVGYALIALADREIRMLIVGVPAGIIALLALVELVKNLTRMWTGRSPQQPSVPAHAGASSKMALR